MTVFWLTPIQQRDPLVLDGDRIPCLPGPDWDSFRSGLTAAHARALPLIKARILADNGMGETGCGLDRNTVPLDNRRGLPFDGRPLRLSGCAQTFLDKLLPPEAVLELLSTTLYGPGSQEEAWLAAVRSWLRQGRQVMIIREDEE